VNGRIDGWLGVRDISVVVFAWMEERPGQDKALIMIFFSTQHARIDRLELPNNC